MVTTSLSLPEIARETRQASRQLAILTNEERNEALEAIADALTANADKILEANIADVQTAKAMQLSPEEAGLVLAHLYRGYWLYGDAVEVLEGLVKQNSRGQSKKSNLGINNHFRGFTDYRFRRFADRYFAAKFKPNNSRWS